MSHRIGESPFSSLKFVLGFNYKLQIISVAAHSMDDGGGQMDVVI